MMSTFDRDVFIHDAAVPIHQMRGLEDVASITFGIFFSDNRRYCVQLDLLMNGATSLPSHGRTLEAHCTSDRLNGA